MYGKRKPVLMSEQMCQHNYCGYYGVPKVNWDFGSDIMTVSSSFGAGGIGVFDVPSRPDSLSMPRFTPFKGEKISEPNFNEDQMTDTRYAFDVVVNGPMRSIIRVKTMHWNTGNGSYELTQDYTAHANQSYSTCRVHFSTFLPHSSGAGFACGIRANTDAQENLVEKGIAIRTGTELAVDPDDDTGQKGHTVEFVGSALVVKDAYAPEYKRIASFGGNHTFRIPVTKDHTYEYLIAGAWSEGAVYNTPASFIAYVRMTAAEYNAPPLVQFDALQVNNNPKER